ncbi:MAG TPA: 30S ribosomal protein S20, partial [Thermoanaerobaculia bacterium]
MANTKSAEKRNRQNVKARERNRAQRSTLRTAIKKLRTAV